MNKICKSTIVNIFLPISLSIRFGCSKNHLIETVLSTHNICFGLEIRKLLSRGLDCPTHPFFYKV